MSDAALRQWYMSFGNDRQIHLGCDDPEPFPVKKDLGRGGYGVVYEVTLGGIPVALKTTRTRKITKTTLRELEVLRHVSNARHRHVVALIGSYVYTEKRKGFHDLGLVIWPVAHCDLQHFMAEVEVLSHYDTPTLSHDSTSDDLRSAIHTASAVVGTEGTSLISELYGRAIERLAGSFGCIANAISWLHDEAHVRHRDLKPAQVLLSREGLWLTDFGVSTFIANLDDTATTGIERMTARYQAPERAQGLPRGRAEDVFALGCMYLEMGYVMAGRSVSDIVIPDRFRSGAWSYEHNLVNCVDTWLKFMDDGSHWSRHRALTSLLRSMLSHDPQYRPTMKAVVQSLEECSNGVMRLSGPCCASAIEAIPGSSDIAEHTAYPLGADTELWSHSTTRDAVLGGSAQPEWTIFEDPFGESSMSSRGDFDPQLGSLVLAPLQYAGPEHFPDPQAVTPVVSTSQLDPAFFGTVEADTTALHLLPQYDTTMLHLDQEGALTDIEFDLGGMQQLGTPISRVDTNKTYCPDCGAVFTGRFGLPNLARHRRLKHSPVYHCGVEGCHAVFKRQDARRVHQYKSHGGPTPALRALKQQGE